MRARVHVYVRVWVDVDDVDECYFAAEEKESTNLEEGGEGGVNCKRFELNGFTLIRIFQGQYKTHCIALNAVIVHFMLLVFYLQQIEV
uniref:Uncharacterized protein n=1 Tax=Glossina austeni TaxID=7395 RepID=A0A1A9V0G8_GLOAU